MVTVEKNLIPIVTIYLLLVCTRLLPYISGSPICVTVHLDKAPSIVGIDWSDSRNNFVSIAGV